MKKAISVILSILIIFGSVAVAGSAAPAEGVDSIDVDKTYRYLADPSNENTAIYPERGLDGGYYMFLPSSADLNNIALNFDCDYVTVTGNIAVNVKSGENFDLTSLFGIGLNEYPVTLTPFKGEEAGEPFNVTFVKSSGVRSMYLVSGDSENHGRTWVDSDKSHEAKGGSVSLLETDGKSDLTYELDEIKARGNGTFVNFIKKPYQIKLTEKGALIKGSDEEHKKWILLANAADITLIHNSITFALAKELNMPFTPNYEHIDLYYDGEYRGSYLLTEKTEVDKTRVDIEDLDDLIEETNNGSDAYENPAVVTKLSSDGGNTDAKTDSPGSYKYVGGLTEPALPEGRSHFAYLLELDFIYRYSEEQTGFITKRGQAVVTKNPEYLTKETGAFISGYFQEFEDAVYSPNGFNAKTGKYYYDYCDLESLVNVYLVNEYSKNYDSFRSSTYFYMPEDSDIMYAGPVWDYDVGYGSGFDFNRLVAANTKNFFAATKYMLRALVGIESFRDAVKETLAADAGIFYNAAEKLFDEGGYIDELSALLKDSQDMNYKLWDMSDKVITALFCTDEVTYENAIYFLKYYTKERLAWLSKETSEWKGGDYVIKIDPKMPQATRFHTGLTIVPEIEPTCDKDGHTERIICTDCGGVFVSGSVLPASHKWAEATCVYPKTCKVCGATDGKPLGHSFVYDPDDERNSDLVKVYKCSRCSEVILENVHKEHDFLPATCTAPKTCKVCGATEGEPLGHDYVYDESDERNSEFVAVYKCSRCSYEYIKDLHEDGHIFAPATCTAPKTCKVCGATEGEPLGHDYVYDEGDERNSEFVAVYKCSRCSYEHIKDLHEDGHIFASATCTAPKTCKVCGATEGEPLGHDYVYDEGDERNNEHTAVYKCARCHEEIITIKDGGDANGVKGDVDGDGRITAQDARTVLRIAALVREQTENDLINGDVNGDGQLTARDARIILRKSAKIE